jgi:hypothetical protein
METLASVALHKRRVPVQGFLAPLHRHLSFHVVHKQTARCYIQAGCEVGDCVAASPG